MPLPRTPPPSRQSQIKTKSTKEVIEFYYAWKKTNHYKQWKRTYTPDERDDPEAAE